MKAVRLSVWMVVALVLTGCGQKGPLTLPSEPAPTSQPAPAESPGNNPQQE